MTAQLLLNKTRCSLSRTFYAVEHRSKNKERPNGCSKQALFLTNNNYFTRINKAAFMLEYKMGKNYTSGQTIVIKSKKACRLWNQNSVISHEKKRSSSRHHPNGDTINYLNTYLKRRKWEFTCWPGILMKRAELLLTTAGFDVFLTCRIFASSFGHPVFFIFQKLLSDTALATFSLLFLKWAFIKCINNSWHLALENSH